MVTSAELLAHLDRLGLRVTTFHHPPVFTVEENKALHGAMPGGHCKNLFLKDKKDALWLVVALEDSPIDMKTLGQRIGSARLSFGRPELLREVLGVEPGSVTPFAVINDRENRVTVVLDRALMAQSPLHYHPLINTATTAIAPDELLRFLEAAGHSPRWVDLAANP